MKYKENYRRPCFAVCANCGLHGVIVIDDNQKSEEVATIEQGKKVLDSLKVSGRISPEDSERIDDQINSSDLSGNTKELLLRLLLISVLDGVCKDAISNN